MTEWQNLNVNISSSGMNSKQAVILSSLSLVFVANFWSYTKEMRAIHHVFSKCCNKGKAHYGSGLNWNLTPKKYYKIQTKDAGNISVWAGPAHWGLPEYTISLRLKEMDSSKNK